jgi:hypothetical protein
MYALLMVVAAMIGITIYSSCSADEDYDGYSSKNELFTLADGIMERGGEDPHLPIYYYGIPIDAGGDTIDNIEITKHVSPEFYTYWSRGFTGKYNPSGPYSNVYAIHSGDYSSCHIDSVAWENGQCYYFSGQFIFNDLKCDWKSTTELEYKCYYMIRWTKTSEFHNSVEEYTTPVLSKTFTRKPKFHRNDSIQPLS